MVGATQPEGHWFGQAIAAKYGSWKVVVGFVLVVFITSLHRYPIASHKGFGSSLIHFRRGGALYDKKILENLSVPPETHAEARAETFYIVPPSYRNVQTLAGP